MNRDEAIRARIEAAQPDSWMLGPRGREFIDWALQDLPHLLDETARLRADLTAMTKDRDALVGQAVDWRDKAAAMVVERDAMREAAERDIAKLLNNAADYPYCTNFCKNTEFCLDRCKPEWRGPDAENKEGQHAAD
jgi:hypothetical protein